MKRLSINLRMIPVLLISIAVETTAQSESSFARFVGSWSGPGKFSGMNAIQQIRWEPVLGNKFVRLSVRVEASRPDGAKQLFEGHAYYRKAESNIHDARWFDSNGSTYPIKAQNQGDILTALWGEPGKIEGRSTYQLLESGKLEVVDAIRGKDGAYREFARFVLIRSGT